MQENRTGTSGLGRPHVVLMVETSSSYGRQILRGITGYLRAHQPWSVFFEERQLGAAPPDWLKSWRGSGIICRLIDRELARYFRRARIPVVNLNDIHESWGLPRVQSDHRRIGELAAEHFLGAGFRHFGFHGVIEHQWSQLRGEGFGRRLELEAASYAVYESPWDGTKTLPWEKAQDALGRWLQGLPRPVAILASNDVWGQRVLDACGRIGASVPEEVAVVGVDNDEILCELCNPPLSSVAPNAARVGHDAAAMLDRLMAGELLDTQEVVVEPIEVVTRQSSDVLAIDDTLVAAALRHIREQACQGLTVEKLLQKVPLSRSILERLFRKYLGHSPQAEIRSVQLKRIKQLLAQTDLALDQIARLAGFRHPEYMNVVFRRETGETPGHYRHRVQSLPSSPGPGLPSPAGPAHAAAPPDLGPQGISME